VVNFDTELVDVTLSAAEKWRLRQRAGLVRGLLTRGRSPTAPGLFLGSRSSCVGDLAGSGAGVIGWFPLSNPRGEPPERSNGAVSKFSVSRLPHLLWC
jgi:hypothetical protein